jgi:hypothetical protein
MNSQNSNPRKSVGQSEKSNLFVTALVPDQFVLRNYVEKLAASDPAPRNFPSPIHDEWEPFIVSSVETYMSGHTFISDGNRIVDTAFDACFIFRCVKQKHNFRLTWALSLS